MKRFYKIFLLFTIVVLTFIVGGKAIAQKSNVKIDSTHFEKHSAKKATYLALVPGLGQIYNKKYWKLPIVYAGFGVSAYYGVTNRKEFIKYNDAYRCSVLEGTDCTNDLSQKYTEDELKSIKDWYRRNMELSFIVMGAWYILQILDASVDAHLYYWEVDDNLSVEVQPIIQPNIKIINPVGEQIPYNGIKVSFKF